MLVSLSMKKTVLLGMICGLLLAGLYITGKRIVERQGTMSGRVLLFDVNVYRASKGVGPVLFSAKDCESAQIRWEEVQTDWSHDGFDADRFCNHFCIMGENLARGFNDEQELISAWKHSPAHEEVMSDPVYKYGCVISKGDYTVLHLSND